MAGAGAGRSRATRVLPTHRGNFPRRHSFLVVRRHTNTVDIAYSSHSKNPSTSPGNTPNSNLFVDFHGRKNLEKEDGNRLRAILPSIHKTRISVYIHLFMLFKSLNSNGFYKTEHLHNMILRFHIVNDFTQLDTLSVCNEIKHGNSSPHCVIFS
ncbi:hypothetical protein [Burkholderia sp. AU45388]|uniref:hypothetical protein n=1 Tax=Burkholderia sp. AU45388 TaxID=3059206 RepID=UPI00264D2EFE|nr:hypothetical protein [Burkholderia sp. AU45388]MDN7431244.1 hypothetical protein [Burkholderia sp. AU45388]